MTREERIVKQLTQELTPELGKQITQLKRHILQLEVQRDRWREAAQRYRNQIMENKRNDTHTQ